MDNQSVPAVEAVPVTQPISSNRLQRLVKQFSKFVIVGGVNTGIDFAVLNALMYMTGISSGKSLILLNCVSFSVAVTNSYFMNRRWTFREAAEKIADKESAVQFTQFAVVSVIGAGINSGILFTFTSFFAPMFGLSPQLWANVGKLLATGVSLVWNFIGYKLVVFKK